MKHKLVIAMTAATLFLVGCGQRQHTEQVTLVRIDTVKTANTCDILEFPARVQAAGEVHLAFKIPGTLQRIYVDDGAFVRQGELVAEMDPRDYELQLQAVEAEYLSIKAEAERVMALYDQNVATADAYDKARYGLQQITAKYENARNQLADTKLYAPFDGYVKRRRFDPPTVVAAGMPVITFLSGKNPEVELFIPASTYIRRREIASFAAVFDFLQGQKFRCVCSMSIRAPMPISFTPCGWHCP
jgi:8a0101: efflux pump membrane protein